MPPIRADFAEAISAANALYDSMFQESVDDLRARQPELASKIQNLPWTKDGIQGKEEWDAISGLIRLLDGVESGPFVQLIEEPWVVEGRNYAALEALGFAEYGMPAGTSVMSNPTITDGITDQEAKILATLPTAAYPAANYLDDHDLLDKLLDPEQITLEERTITLPLSGETELTLIRTRPGAAQTMDSLEHSVRAIEELMGFPFPRRQLIFLIVEAPGGGAHKDTHVHIRQDELVDDRAYQGATLTLIAHEASHYYWKSIPSPHCVPADADVSQYIWLGESVATFIEYMVYHSSPSKYRPVTLDEYFRFGNSPCTIVQSIAEFEDLVPDKTNSWNYYDCQYTLGARLFHDLYNNMDETAFSQALRRLYLHTYFDTPVCDDDPTVICHLREAFTTYASEETRATVESLIDRHYYGKPE